MSTITSTVTITASLTINVTQAAISTAPSSGTWGWSAHLILPNGNQLLMPSEHGYESEDDARKAGVAFAERYLN